MLETMADRFGVNKKELARMVQMQDAAESNISKVRKRLVSLYVSRGEKWKAMFERQQNIQKQQTTLQAKLQSLQSCAYRLQDAAKANQTESARLTQEKNALSSAIQVLEDSVRDRPAGVSGAIAAAVQVMQQRFDGIKGCLCALIWTSERYVAAASAVMGESLRNTIVVQSRNDAVNVVRYFEAQKLPVVVCEILDEITAQHTSDGSLSDVVLCEDEIKPLVQKLFGSWVLAANVQEAATRPRSGCNCVTLDGIVFANSGEVSRKPPASVRVATSQSLAHGLVASAQCSPDVVGKQEELQRSHARQRQLNAMLANAKQSGGSSAAELTQVTREYTDTKKRLTALAASSATVERSHPSTGEIAAIVALSQAMFDNCSSACIAANRQQLVEMAMQHTRELAERKQLQASLSCSKKKAAGLRKQLEQIGQLLKESNARRDDDVDRLREAKAELQELRAAKSRTRKEMKRAQTLFCAKQAEVDKVIEESEALASRVETLVLQQATCRQRLLECVDPMNASGVATKEVEMWKRELKTLSEINLTQFQDAIDREAALLCSEKELLDQRKGKLNFDALERDRSTRMRLEVVRGTLHSVRQEQETLLTLATDLEKQRHQQFVEGMAKLNAGISVVFRQFAEHGDASLSYSSHPLLTFSEGVMLNVRPDRTAGWKPFPSLSGGQQALAWLALCLAIQSHFPAPFYLFDEIDAALDVVNAQRVAACISNAARHAGSQFIVVSLRPEMYEQYSILGVYSSNGTTRTMLCELKEAQK
eukprot:TRINITY_DN3882_c0_g1_i1.p1 TRINITY_DN3882_c0_g1~~TRINITY_DN3882_c0_g1_i1.p1  ORF type:complete len:765 (+),score=171.36 TRINITY_DN3882_c0_g1_i1:1172-3466(+)